MKANHLFLILLILLSGFVSKSQSPNIEWQRSIGGSQNETLLKVIELPNKGFVLLGTSNSCDGIATTYEGAEDVIITMIDYSGNIQWTKTWGGSGNEKPVDAYYNPDNDIVYILVESNSNDGDLAFKSKNNSLVFIIGIKSNGILAWNIKDCYPNYLKDAAINGYKLVQEDYHPYILGKIKAIENTNEYNSASILGMSRVTNEKIYIGNNFSIFPHQNDTTGFFNAQDLIRYSYENTEGFLLFGTCRNPELQTPELNLKPGKNPPVSKILEGFHGSKGHRLPPGLPMPLRRDLRLPQQFKNANSDACIIKTFGGNGYVIMWIDSKCIGGSGNDTALEIFAQNPLNYRCIISSDSKDGDFKTNLGGNDIWVVDINKDLKIKEAINLGTSKNDFYLNSIHTQSDFAAVLINSGDEDDKVRDTFIYNGVNSLINSNDNSEGLKLYLIGKNSIIKKINFNLSDKNAKVFEFSTSELIVVATYINDNNASLILICVDSDTGTVKWVHTYENKDFKNIISINKTSERSYQVFANAALNNTSKNNYDYFIAKFDEKEFPDKDFYSFNDNLGEVSIPDSVAINTILEGKIISDSAFPDWRQVAFQIYKRDTTNVKALMAFSQLSEYLADYAIAANGYSLLITKLDKAKEKSLLSKIRAHQITCNFLTQSQEKPVKGYNTNNTENKNGFFGIGVRFTIFKNHVYVNNVTKRLPADVAGIQLFDEILKVNDNVLSGDCITTSLITSMMRNENNSPVILHIKRLGQDKPFDITIDRAFIAYSSSDVPSEDNKTESGTDNSLQQQLNPNQQQKQSFLKKMITALQTDSSIMKNIETAKKINYALAILNKWANEPASKNFFLQIDEQAGIGVITY